jgi:hypothetical protein
VAEFDDDRGLRHDDAGGDKNCGRSRRDYPFSHSGFLHEFSNDLNHVVLRIVLTQVNHQLKSHLFDFPASSSAVVGAGPRSVTDCRDVMTPRFAR